MSLELTHQTREAVLKAQQIAIDNAHIELSPVHLGKL